MNNFISSIYNQKNIVFTSLYRLVILFTFLSSQSYFTQTVPEKKSAAPAKVFDNSATDSDYLLSIEKTDEILQSAYMDADFSSDAYRVFKEMEMTDEKLTLILESLKTANLDVKNQQMYKTVLLELKDEMNNQNKVLNTSDERINKIRDRIADLRKDAVIMSLVKDTVLRKKFSVELKALGERYVKTYDLINKNLGILNKKKRLMLEHKTTTFNALMTVEDKLEQSGRNLFKTEYPFLWQSSETSASSENAAKRIRTERNVNGYYFNHISGGLIALVFFMGLMVWYVKRNLKYLQSNGNFANLSHLNFKYFNNGIFLPITIVGLNIILLSNLYAPSSFINLIQLILLVSLLFLLKKEWSPESTKNWIFLIALFITLCLIDLFVKANFLGRSIFIGVNILAIRYVISQLKRIDTLSYNKIFFKWGGYIFIGLMGLSVILNLFGRVSLSYTISLTATIALSQIIAFSALLRIIMEIILLQIYTSRVKRGITKLFDYKSVTKNLKLPFIILLSYMWFAIVTANLNIWGYIYSKFNMLIDYPNKIGSITFTLGNILLFFMLIWIAHLLQKYVAYFFGEIDDDEDEENINKKQHSKLLITRLLVLTCGYLLAIAASGMPMDKISIVIGALGVGVGLGLQSIVNNFVSGIVLIFDRPIQIGDIIDVGTQTGRVKAMDLRTTKINAPNGAEIIIPNGSMLSQNITNWTYTDNLKLVEINFTVSNTTSIENINTIVNESLDGIAQVDSSKAIQIYYNSLSEANYGLLIKFWCSIYRVDEVVSNTKQSLHSHFKEKDIAITI
jgi:potassium efflux system protein